MTATAIYKGRPYRLLGSGKTKFGERAHLAFLDGSKDFWVSLGAVTLGAPQRASGSGISGRLRPGECGCGEDLGGMVRRIPGGYACDECGAHWRD